MTTPPIRRGDGFTLVEVLVAMSIAAVGFLGLAATHVASLRATVVGRNVTLATSVASESLEALRRLPYASLASTSPASVARDNVTFTSTATVAASSATSKKVTMNVSWHDQFGVHTNGVQLITVISE
jgi:type IV pilus assembly protein PilV